MRAKIHPTGPVLVGRLLICAFSVPGLAGLPLATGETGASKDPFIDISDQRTDKWGIIESSGDAVYFPWYGRESMTMPTAHSAPARSSSSTMEQIELNSSHSAVEVESLTAVNTQGQRDLHYDASSPQEGDAEFDGLENSLDISVQGEEEEISDSGLFDAIPYDSLLEDLPEDISENVSSGSTFPHNRIRQAGNYLNIEVKDITVSAINTMEGGSAVATSNIVIEPVQIIYCPSEVNAKLK